MKKTYYLWLIIFFWACQNDNISSPSIPEEELITILSEIHFAEAALDKTKELDKDSVADVFYQHIFDKHDISQQTFENTMQYYKVNPTDLSLLYEKVIENLGKQEVSTQTKKTENNNKVMPQPKKNRVAK